MAKLSIIVPVYNAEIALKKCLDSIASQTFQDWECFLINDGSSDKSGSICNAYSVFDSRFKVIHKYNEGPAATRNLGIYLSKGEWISFVDADDWINPNRYEVAIAEAEKNKVSIVQCAINVVKDGKTWRTWHLGDPGIYKPEDGKVFSDPLYDIGHCWDKIYKAELLKKNNITFAACDMCEDTLFNIKTFCLSKGILSIEDVLYNYNFNSDSLSHTTLTPERKIKLIKSIESSLKDFKKLPGFSYIESQVINTFEAVLARDKKIDYVFPYVDNTKDTWLKEFCKYTEKNIDSTKNGTNRFRACENLLKYKFRAIEKWMPWIGTIHLIVSDITQVPSWINQDKVRIVLHKDIIPEAFLPTFNSCTIEMFIHNIFGLSEKFIYSNDDVYPNSVLKPKFYFADDNILKSDFHIRKLWHDGDINQVWAQIPQNSIKLVANDTPNFLNKYVDGVHLYELQHIGRPMFRSTNKLVSEKYDKEICQSITRIRDAKNFNQTIFTAYALFHGRGSFETFKHSYFQIGRETEKICNAILEPIDDNRVRSICCNDTDISTEDDFNKIEIAFLEKYPSKSKYEL